MTKWQFLLILLKRVENDPFLRPQMRAKDTSVDEVFEIPFDIYLR